MPLENDVVLGERAGLVGAKHVHGAKILDGVKPLHDHAVAREVHGTLRKAGRHDHGQHLGRETNGNREREEQRREPVALRESVDDEDERRHDHHEAQQEPAHQGDSLVIGSLAALGTKTCRHAAKHGVCTSGDNHCHPTPRDHGGAHEHYVVEIPRGAGVIGGRGARRCHTLHGKALPRERRHAEKEVARLDEPCVRRHDVARCKVHDVADNHVCQGNLHAPLVRALDVAGGLYRLGERRGGGVALALLHEPQSAGDGDHRENDDEGRRVARGGCSQDHISDKRHHCEKREDSREGVHEGLREAHRHRVAMGVHDLV